jgi:MoaA/NifB/PqqE/SkfB family radical SAM enzyme
VHDLDLEVIAPFSEIPQAPYRMDLALTYRCNDDCSHCYNARPRTYPERPTEDWRAILDRIWEIGIPHVCFTGGEATLRRDLAELVAYSHALGHVVGLLSNGRRLSHAAYTKSLAAAGLDHVQITLESHREEVHDRMVGARGAWRETVAGIRNALDSGLHRLCGKRGLAAVYSRRSRPEWQKIGLRNSPGQITLLTRVTQSSQTTECGPLISVP